MNDLVWVNAADDRIASWRMHGTQRLAVETWGEREPGTLAKGTGDVDGDGDEDLIFQRRDNGSITAWLLDGTRVVERKSLGRPTPGHEVVGVVDVDGNGAEDVVLRGPGGQMAAWLLAGGNVERTASMPATPADVVVRAGMGPETGTLNLYAQPARARGQVTMTTLAFKAPGTFVEQAKRTLQPSVGPEWRIRCVGDLDRDGAADLIWQNNATSDVTMWMGDPVQPTSFKGTGFGSTNARGPGGRWYPVGLRSRMTPGIRYPATDPAAQRLGVTTWMLTRAWQDGHYLALGADERRVLITAQVRMEETYDAGKDEPEEFARTSFFDTRGVVPSEDRALFVAFFLDYPTTGGLPHPEGWGTAGAVETQEGAKVSASVQALTIGPDEYSGEPPPEDGTETNCHPVSFRGLDLELRSHFELFRCLPKPVVLEFMSELDHLTFGPVFATFQRFWGCKLFVEASCARVRAQFAEACCLGQDHRGGHNPLCGLDFVQPRVCSCEWRFGRFTQGLRWFDGLKYGARCGMGPTGPYMATMTSTVKQRAYAALPNPEVPCAGKVIETSATEVRELNVSALYDWHGPPTFEPGYEDEGGLLCGGPRRPRVAAFAVGSLFDERVELVGSTRPGVYLHSIEQYGGAATRRETRAACMGWDNDPEYQRCRSQVRAQDPKVTACLDSKPDARTVTCRLLDE